MKEVTMTCNAQITIVVTDWREDHLPFDERGITYAIRDMLGADDVTVKNMKHFVMDKED